MLAQNLSVIAPELALSLAAMGLLMWGAYSSRDASGAILWSATAILAATGLWVGFQPATTAVAFDGSFISDGFSRFAKVLILFGAAATLAMSRDYLLRHDVLKYEFSVLILLSTVGMMTMVSARDLIVLYMGLELQSLAAYVLASFRRDSLRSTEAGLKYFVLGALSSGLLLYGASLAYGYSGSTTFVGVANAIGDAELSLGLIFGLVFLSAGMAFKISAAPFHMWTPDVYEGAPTPVTAFFATAPKVAASVMFARVLYDAFGSATEEWRQILAFLSIASMFLGSVAAIGQRNIKRLMAYSSIAHMGFALMGLAAGTEQGAQALLIYLAIYVVMNVGVFAFILNMEKDGKAVSDISALGLYSQVHPARAAAVAVLMFSLAGVPPLVGFFGKLYVLRAAVDADMFWLAIAGVAASVVGAYYYLRIVYLMYFGDCAEGLDGRMPALHWGFLGASAAAMLLGIINLFGVETIAAAAAATLFQ